MLPAKRQATASAASMAFDLEGIGDSRAEELTVFRIVHDRGAGEENTVTDRQRHVAGDLPVQKNVRLETEIPLIVGRLINRGVVVELVVEEEIQSDLGAREGTVIRQGKRDAADAEDQHVGNLRRKRQAGIEQAEAVESAVGGAGLIAGEGGRGLQAIVIPGGADDLGAEAGLAPVEQ